MIVKVNVNNLPSKIERGFMVVRLFNADLWYYGQYKDESRAIQAAQEIGNGLVMEVSGNDT